MSYCVEYIRVAQGGRPCGLEEFDESFAARREWLYGIFDRATDPSIAISERKLIGGAGLHPHRTRRVDDRLPVTGGSNRAGVPTEAVRALVRVGIIDFGAKWIEIRCDPSNAQSAAIPRWLGFRHTTTLERNTLTPTGEPRDTNGWQTTAAEFVEWTDPMILRI